MGKRLKEINQTISNLYKLKEFERCCICGSTSNINAAHIVSRSAHYRRNDPSHELNIMPLCYNCHTKYDNSPMKVKKELLSNGKMSNFYYKRLLWIIQEIDKEPTDNPFRRE